MRRHIIFFLLLCLHGLARGQTSTLTGFYWFDNESMVYEAPNLKGSFDVDVSSMSDGFHQISFFATQSDGGQSNPQTCYFLKIAQVLEDDSLTCLCSVDRQLKHVEKLSQQGGVIHWDLDMQNLTDGVHHIELQAMTKSGALSKSYSTYFMRVTSTEELSEMRCIYSIDNDSFETKSEIVGHNGKFHFDLDLPELDEGLHYITFLLNNDRGTSTTAQTRFFVKAPIGGNGIDRYQYWLNEDSIEQATTITLPQKVNPLQLFSLLPIESRPLRSSLFHFETSSGKPMVYAKNTIHLRFYDAAMRFSDIAKDYADYSVGQEVKPVGELQATQTFPKMAENDVRWYTVNVAAGDSLAFKLSQPATIQVFAPYDEKDKENKEVFKLSGSASVNWNGLHVAETGTFYVALHDVTATQGETISINYEHIDKYALLENTPKEVGLAANIVEIQIIGNGYDKLTHACLALESDTIWTDCIKVQSKAVATLQFTLDGSEKSGSYNLLLYFEDEGVVEHLTAQEGLNLVPAEWGEIKVDVAMGQGITRPYPATISITNTGNISKLYVPFNLAYSNVNSIESMNFENFVLPKNTDDDGWIAGYAENLASMGVAAKVMSLFIPMLGPRETKVLKVSFSAPSNTPFNVYAWTGKAINTPTNEDDLEKTNIPSVLEYFEAADEDSGDINTLYNELNDVAQEMATATDSVYNSVTPNQTESAVLRGHIVSAAASVSPVRPIVIVNVIDHRKGGGGYTTKHIEFIGGHYPNPPGIGGNSGLIPNPFDPNDIYGYLSEAGSKFIADSVARVNYTIEFENDTTFATAAAHTIVIKDTLDNKVFDLTKFMPTGIRIGSREAFLDAADVVIKNNVTSFVKTIDMRPEINAIAQVDGTFNQKNGIAQWTIQSLDPMTMEPTDDLMQGILPVNYNGTSGIGEVMFEVGVKQGKADGTQIKNRAGIVFDYEEAILTPIWTNIVDAVAPSSVIDNSWMLNDSTLRITADAFDARSGVWKYEWYVQAGENAPWWKEGETESPQFDYHIFEGIDYGFCVLATDSAGNVEQKVIQRERGFKTYGQDFEDRIDEANGQSSMVNGQSIYDLSGRRQAAPKENQINIIDKKKVLIR